MSVFIKAGLWLEKKIGYKGEFNLTKYIQELIAETPPPPGGDFIPLSGTTVGNPVTGDVEFAGNIGSKYNFYDDYFEIKGNESEDVSGIFLSNNSSPFGIFAGSGLTQRLLLDPSGFRIQSLNHSISANSGSSIIITDNELLRGMQGAADYSANITDLDYAQKIYVDTKVADSRPYRVYTAILTQIGTNAPVATVLENTLLGTVTFQYVSNGIYTATLIGAFTTGKTTATLDGGTFNQVFKAVQNNINTVRLVTYGTSGSVANDQMGLTTLEIRVYN